MLTDDLAALNLGMQRDDVLLTPPASNWALAFELLRNELQRNLPNLARHHVGSTAIPNLPAKPILDIFGVLPSPDSLDTSGIDPETLV